MCVCHEALAGVPNPHQGKPCPGRAQKPAPVDEAKKRMCTSKRHYKSQTKALVAAVRLARLGPQRAYRCPHCKRWHLTTSRALTNPSQHSTGETP
jgi:hypothetical protein